MTAVSGFRRFWTRYFGICQFFLRYCDIVVLGTLLLNGIYSFIIIHYCEKKQTNAHKTAAMLLVNARTKPFLSYGN